MVSKIIIKPPVSLHGKDKPSKMNNSGMNPVCTCIDVHILS